MPTEIHPQPSGLASLAGRQAFCARARRQHRRALAFLGLASLTLINHAAETPLSPNDLIPENTSLWTESMLWDKELSLSSGLGYNNNVLLSAFNPHGSAFFVNGLDLTVIRLPLDGWKVSAIVTGEDIRYWRNEGANGEDNFISSVRVERELPGDWQAGLEARGLYEKQVLDTTTQLGRPTTALVEGYGVTGQPSLRKNLNIPLWLQLEVPVTRWYFDSPLDNYWEFGPIVTAGYDFSPRADITLSYGASYEMHDQWIALNAFGLVPSHTNRLEILQHRVELAWHQYWDSDRQWRSSTRLIFAYKEDNGGGFFNYYQYQAVEDLRWRTADWEIKGSAQAAYEDYPVQGDGSLDGKTLQRTLLNFSLNIERRLLKEFWCYAKLEYQQTISNEVLDAGNYNGTTVSGGLRLKF